MSPWVCFVSSLSIWRMDVRVCVCNFVSSLVFATFIRAWSMCLCTPIFVIKMMMMMMTDESTSRSDSFDLVFWLLTYNGICSYSGLATEMIKWSRSTKIETERE